MNFLKSLVEFVGTYVALVVIILAATNTPKYVPLVVGLVFFIVVFLFQHISANFNPAVTLMFVSLKKQPVTDLITLIIPQLLAGLAAAQTFVLIKKLI